MKSEISRRLKRKGERVSSLVKRPIGVQKARAKRKDCSHGRRPRGIEAGSRSQRDMT